MLFRLLLNASYHAVDHGSVAIDNAAVDAVLGVGADDAFRRLKLIVFQLCRLLGDGSERGIQPRTDGSTTEHAFLVDHRKRGCRT